MQLPEQVRSKQALACTHTWQSSVAFLASVTWILGLFLPAEAWNDGFSTELATSTAMPVHTVLVFGVIFFLKKNFAHCFVCFVMVLDFLFCTRNIALTAVRACELLVFIITNFKCVFIQNLQLI